MTDFGLSVYKVKPDLKCYLYLSLYGNVIDELLSQSLDSSSYMKILRHPFTAHDLNVIMGVGNEKQSIVVREAETLDDSEWLVLDHFLSQPRIKNLSVFILGQSATGEGYAKLRARVARQGLFIEATDPNTPLSQKHLSEWFGDQCIVNVSDSYAVCQKLAWNLGDILWVVKAYKSVSGGKQLDTMTSRKLLQICCPETTVEDAYSLLIQKKSKESLAFVSGMNYNQTLRLFNRLDAVLKDIVVMKPHVAAGLSTRAISEKSGVHIVKVLRVKDFVPRYSEASLTNCQNLLNFGLDNVYQPEVAKLVASLWS